MALGPQSVRMKGKTARYVVSLLLGSAAVVAAVTYGLIEVAGEVLPPPPSAPSANTKAPAAPATGEQPSPALEPPAPEPAPEKPDPELSKLKACCAALRQNGGAIPIEYKAAYVAAISACKVLEKSPHPENSRREVRALLEHAPTPAACR